MKNSQKSNRTEDENSVSKAMKRYRRIKTIINKAVELADLCNLQVNVLIHDPKINRFKEHYTTPDIKLEALKQLARDQLYPSTSRKRYQKFKFQCIDARTSYQEDVDHDLP